MPDHALTADGAPIHVDVDPLIPTGICVLCIPPVEYAEEGASV